MKKSEEMIGKDHGQFFRQFLERVNPKFRSFVTLHKYFGKYFIKFPGIDEKEKLIKTNTAIIEDVKNEKEAIEFALKLKACVTKTIGECSIHYYYFPNYSADEVAIAFAGHHILHDGIT